MQQGTTRRPGTKPNAIPVCVERFRVRANVVDSAGEIRRSLRQQWLRWWTKAMRERHGDYSRRCKQPSPGLKNSPILWLVLRARAAVNKDHSRTTFMNIEAWWK